MHSFPTPPRQVRIGDAAAFAGTTPRAVRHYHQLGLLPEPERGGDDRRPYDYEDVIRLLWIRRMADAGVALDDVRRAQSPDGEDDLDGVLERLEASLAAQEDELRRQRAAVSRMRTRGSRLGLLSELVAGRLEHLSEGVLRPADLDTLLAVERLLGPVVAAVRATRFLALAAHPQLRERCDRLDAAEEALDDTVAVNDPRVAQVAAERAAFEQELHAAIEESGLAAEEDAALAAWEAQDPRTPERGTSAVDVARSLPHGLSPARLRSAQLVEELAARS